MTINVKEFAEENLGKICYLNHEIYFGNKKYKMRVVGYEAKNGEKVLLEALERIFPYGNSIERMYDDWGDWLVMSLRPQTDINKYVLYSPSFIEIIPGQHPFRSGAHTCTCDLSTLMRSGCKCGGV